MVKFIFPIFVASRNPKKPVNVMSLLNVVNHVICYVKRYVMCYVMFHVVKIR